MPEWVDGTAVYYWFLNPMFGVTDGSKPFVVSILFNPVAVVVVTCGALVLEFLIFIMVAFRNSLQKNTFLLPPLYFIF